MRINEQKAREIFNETIKGGNFMTPNIEEHGENNGYIYELASGDSMNGGKIYGVTIVEDNGGKWEHNHELSECFHDSKEARDYINNL